MKGKFHSDYTDRHLFYLGEVKMCIMNSTKTLVGKCVSSRDHVVIYGINFYYDHQLKMLSRFEPAKYLTLTAYKTAF